MNKRREREERMKDEMVYWLIFCCGGTIGSAPSLVFTIGLSGILPSVFVASLTVLVLLGKRRVAETENARLRDALMGEIISLHKWHGHSAKDIMQCHECAESAWEGRMLKAIKGE